MSKRVLIIVDMLNDFIDEKGTLFCGPAAREIIPFIKARFDKYRANSDAVIFLTDSHDEDDLEFNRFPKHAVANTWGSEIIKELTSLSKDDHTSEMVHTTIISKQRYSGFYNTGLELTLSLLPPGSNQVEVVGVCTSICVMDTVGGLANRDFDIKVPAVGVADFDPEMHEFALKRMKALYGADTD